MNIEFDWLPFRNGGYQKEVFRLQIKIADLEFHFYMPFGFLDVGCELQYGQLMERHGSLAINCVVWIGLCIFIVHWGHYD